MLKLSQLKIKLLIIFIIHIGFVNVSAFAFESNHKTKCEMRVGWTSWPPYIGRNEKGDMVGLQFDLYKAIAKEAGCHFTFVEDSWKDNIQGIAEGTIDIIGNASVTPERSRYAYFSIPYRPETFALYVLAKQADRFPQNNIELMLKNGFVVGLTQDNYYGPQLEKLTKQPALANRFKSYERSIDNYKALLKGEINGFFDDPLIFAYSVRRLGYEGLMLRHHVIVNQADVSLMFSKKTVSQTMIERLNRAIKAVRQSESYLKDWEW